MVKLGLYMEQISHLMENVGQSIMAKGESVAEVTTEAPLVAGLTVEGDKMIELEGVLVPTNMQQSVIRVRFAVDKHNDTVVGGQGLGREQDDRQQAQLRVYRDHVPGPVGTEEGSDVRVPEVGQHVRDVHN
jgi:hypothetical protein